MRKAIASVLTLLMIITCLPTIAFAQDNSNQFDIDQFFCDAEITETTKDVVTFENTEILEKRTENGRTFTDNVSTSLSFVATDEIGRQELAALATSNNDKYKEKSDSTYTVRIYTRIYYTTTVSKGVTYFDLTKVTGGISGGGSGHSLGNGIYIVGNSCVANQKGRNINGGTSTHTQTKSLTNSQRSWTFTIPSSWVPVEDTIGSRVQAIYTVKLKRSNSNWSVSLSNNATSD